MDFPVPEMRDSVLFPDREIGPTYNRILDQDIICLKTRSIK